MLKITKREREVLTCISQGLTIEKTGEVLGIARSTVRTYLSFSKITFKAKTTGELMYKIGRLGVLEET